MKDPDDWESTVVTVTTGNDEQTAELTGSSALYGGQPSASVGYGNGMVPGTWQVSVPISQLEALDDFILIATYQLELELD